MCFSLSVESKMDDTTVATLAGDHRRLSMVTIFLASMAFLLVATSVAAFIYVTRKGKVLVARRTDVQGMKSLSENVLRKLHLIAVVIIILVELAFFVAVIICCATHSKSKRHILLTSFSSPRSMFAQVRSRRFWQRHWLFYLCWH